MRQRSSKGSSSDASAVSEYPHRGSDAAPSRDATKDPAPGSTADDCPSLAESAATRRHPTQVRRSSTRLNALPHVMTAPNFPDITCGNPVAPAASTPAACVAANDVPGAAVSRCICTDDPVEDLLQKHRRRSLPSLPVKLPLRLLLPYALPHNLIKAATYNETASKGARKRLKTSNLAADVLKKEQQQEEQQGLQQEQQRDQQKGGHTPPQQEQEREPQQDKLEKHKDEQQPGLVLYTATLLLEEVISFCEQKVTLELLPHRLHMNVSKTKKKQGEENQAGRFSSLAAALTWLQRQLHSEGAVLPAAAGCLCSSYRNVFDCMQQAQRAAATAQETAAAAATTETPTAAHACCASSVLMEAATHEAREALQLLPVFKSIQVAAATTKASGTGAHPVEREAPAFSAAAAAAAAWAAAASDPPPLRQCSSSRSTSSSCRCEEVLRVAAVGSCCCCTVSSPWVSLSAWRSFCLASHPSVRLYDLLLLAAGQRRLFAAGDSSPDQLQQLMEASALVACMEQQHQDPSLEADVAAVAAADTAMQCANAAVRELVGSTGPSSSCCRRVATWIAAPNPFAEATATKRHRSSDGFSVPQLERQQPACLAFLVVLPEEDLLGNSGTAAAAAAAAKRAWTLGAPAAVPLICGTTFYSAPSRECSISKFGRSISRVGSGKDSCTSNSSSKATELQHTLSEWGSLAAAPPGLPILRCC